MAAVKKTNVMRILEQAKIEYSCHEYEYDENDLDGHHVADYLKIPYEEVFKTLVARSDKGEYLVFCLSVDDEVDFKKAARLAGVKSVEMIHVKDLTAITGYVRGGCSPLGMKKAFPTVIDASARQYSEIYVSGGRIGTSIRLDPQDLARVVRATFADILARP